MCLQTMSDITMGKGKRTTAQTMIGYAGTAQKTTN
jgi:hypothetical protein